MLVSVVIPIHGEAPWVIESLESVANQNHSNIELVIVFDRVSKRTELLVLEFCKSSTLRFKIEKSSEPGIVAALNLGVGISNGELIARLDSDDVMATERLTLQTEEFLKDTNLVILGTQVTYISSSNELIGQSLYPLTDADVRFQFMYRNPVAHPSVVFKRDVFLKVGGYRQFSEGAEDYDLWIRMSQHGVIRNLSRSLTFYRRSSRQVTTINYSKQIHLDSVVRIENQDAIFSSSIGTFLRQEEIESPIVPIGLCKFHRELLDATKKKSRRNYYKLTSSNFLNKALRSRKAKSPFGNLRSIVFIILAFLLSPDNSSRLIMSMYRIKKYSTHEI